MKGSAPHLGKDEKRRALSSSSPAKRSGAGEGDRPQGGGGGLLAPAWLRFTCSRERNFVCIPWRIRGGITTAWGVPNMLRWSEANRNHLRRNHLLTYVGIGLYFISFVSRATQHHRAPMSFERKCPSSEFPVTPQQFPVLMRNRVFTPIVLICHAIKPLPRTKKGKSDAFFENSLLNSLADSSPKCNKVA
jgi:hypothetical protein